MNFLLNSIDKERAKKTLDSLFLFVLLFSGLLSVVHGKALGTYILLFKGPPYNPNYGVTAHLIVFISSACIVWIRSREGSPTSKALAAVVMGGCGTLFSALTSYLPSTMILFLQLFLYATVICVIYFEDFIRKDLGVDFWKILTDSVLKAMRYIIALFLGAFAVLQFVSERNNESTSGFLTTFIYPCLVMILSFFILGYWLFIPAWENLVRSYEKANKENSSGTSQS